MMAWFGAQDAARRQAQDARDRRHKLSWDLRDLGRDMYEDNGEELDEAELCRALLAHLVEMMPEGMGGAMREAHEAMDNGHVGQRSPMQWARDVRMRREASDRMGHRMARRMGRDNEYGRAVQNVGSGEEPDRSETLYRPVDHDRGQLGAADRPRAHDARLAYDAIGRMTFANMFGAQAASITKQGSGRGGAY